MIDYSFSTTLLVVGRIIGTGIFSTPSSIITSVGSLGAAMMLWVLGILLSFAGLAVWLELGTIFPRSGGEKGTSGFKSPHTQDNGLTYFYTSTVYLEACYKRPKLLATVLFATNAIFLGFTASGCIV